MIAISVRREYSMHDPIQNFLAQRECLILDGALATELQQRGADLLDPLWSAKCLIDTPELIRAVHFDYFCAGADVATTATYQATFEGFGRRGLDHHAAEQLMRGAVTLAIMARNEFWGDEVNRAGRVRPLVAASVGPYGAMLADGSEYRGRYGVDDRALADFHRPRLQILADSGADLLACETIPCLREARVLSHLLQEEFPAVPAWMSFSCLDDTRNCEGEDMGECVAELNGYAQIVAVGVNCTPPQHMSPLLRRMREKTRKPLLVYPNSGEHFDASNKQWNGGRKTLPLGEQARQWRMQGARLIGGCCRTGPDDIRGVAQCLAC